MDDVWFIGNIWLVEEIYRYMSIYTYIYVFTYVYVYICMYAYIYISLVCCFYFHIHWLSKTLNEHTSDICVCCKKNTHVNHINFAR